MAKTVLRRGVLTLVALSCTSCVSRASASALAEAHSTSGRALTQLDRTDPLSFCADSHDLDSRLNAIVEPGCAPFVAHPDDRRAERVCEVAAADARLRKRRVRAACKAAARAAARAPPPDPEAAVASARARHAEALAVLRDHLTDCEALTARRGGKPSGGPDVPPRLSDEEWARRMEQTKETLVVDDRPVPRGAQDFRPLSRGRALEDLVLRTIDDACNLQQRMPEHEGAREVCMDASTSLTLYDEAIEHCWQLAEPE